MPNAIKTTAKYILKDPESRSASTLRDFCLALERGEDFNLERLYDLKPRAFEMAIEVLQEWRFDRHVTSRRLGKYLAESD